MKSISGKAFSRILENRGWELVRVKGSHHIYMKVGCFDRISVPVHGNEDMKTGLMKHFMKIAGIEEKDL